MKRIALIGENSVEYVSALLDIWNFGNCAVLIDWRIPISTACEMMADAGTAVCYIEKKRFNDNIKLDYPDIEFIEFESSISSAAKLPTEIYSKFRNNYSTDEIYTQFNRMIENKCAILITHRLSAVQLSDTVAVFDKGHVAEYGTHKELYAKNGIYTEMFNKQAQFYRDEQS